MQQQQVSVPLLNARANTVAANVLRQTPQRVETHLLQQWRAAVLENDIFEVSAVYMTALALVPNAVLRKKWMLDESATELYEMQSIICKVCESSSPWRLQLLLDAAATNSAVPREYARLRLPLERAEDVVYKYYTRDIAAAQNAIASDDLDALERLRSNNAWFGWRDGALLLDHAFAYSSVEVVTWLSKHAEIRWDELLLDRIAEKNNDGVMAAFQYLLGAGKLPHPLTIEATLHNLQNCELIRSILDKLDFKTYDQTLLQRDTLVNVIACMPHDRRPLLRAWVMNYLQSPATPSVSLSILRAWLNDGLIDIEHCVGSLARKKHWKNARSLITSTDEAISLKYWPLVLKNGGDDDDEDYSDWVDEMADYSARHNVTVRVQILQLVMNDDVCVESTWITFARRLPWYSPATQRLAVDVLCSLRLQHDYERPQQLLKGLLHKRDIDVVEFITVIAKREVREHERALDVALDVLQPSLWLFLTRIFPTTIRTQYSRGQQLRHLFIALANDPLAGAAVALLLYPISSILLLLWTTTVICITQTAVRRQHFGWPRLLGYWVMAFFFMTGLLALAHMLASYSSVAADYVGDAVVFIRQWILRMTKI